MCARRVIERERQGEEIGTSYKKTTTTIKMHPTHALGAALLLVSYSSSSFSSFEIESAVHRDREGDRKSVFIKLWRCMWWDALENRGNNNITIETHPLQEHKDDRRQIDSLWRWCWWSCLDLVIDGWLFAATPPPPSSSRLSFYFVDHSWSKRSNLHLLHLVDHHTMMMMAKGPRRRRRSF